MLHYTTRRPPGVSFPIVTQQMDEKLEALARRSDEIDELLARPDVASDREQAATCWKHALELNPGHELVKTNLETLSALT